MASRVETAVTMRAVTNSMGQVVKGMDKAMESMNLERVSRSLSKPTWSALSFPLDTSLIRCRPLTSDTQISLVMDKFESQFTDLDVQTSYMEGAMSDTTAVATPQDQVDNLINQVADEAGLEREHALQLPPTAAPAQAVPAAVEKDKVGEEDGRLADRLRALRVSRSVYSRGTGKGEARIADSIARYMIH